ncbi:MAG TPA: VOC family protein [Gaiellaceae bacterium]|nr:VOC family protein [Gaiellaceae bacterium]
MAHIALAVRDQARSRDFYETYFGFDPTSARVADDGVLLIAGPHDVLLALGETDEEIRLPGFLHFGFRGARDPDEVRAFRERLAADGIEIVEFWDEPDYVSVKCRDPDGYVIELAWEP